MVLLPQQAQQAQQLLWHQIKRTETCSVTQPVWAISEWHSPPAQPKLLWAEALMQHTEWPLSVSVHVLNDISWLQ